MWRPFLLKQEILRAEFVPHCCFGCWLVSLLISPTSSPLLRDERMTQHFDSFCIIWYRNMENRFFSPVLWVLAMCLWHGSHDAALDFVCVHQMMVCDISKAAITSWRAFVVLKNAGTEFHYWFDYLDYVVKHVITFDGNLTGNGVERCWPHDNFVFIWVGFWSLVCGMWEMVEAQCSWFESCL